jgi:hypothetical protein
MRREPRARFFPLPALALCLAACASAPPSRTHADIVRDQLTSIIALKGSPCGPVIDYVVDERLDYRVVCASGDVYRIRVRSTGHVETTPHQGPPSSPP